MVAAINTLIYAVYEGNISFSARIYTDCCTNELRQLKCMLKPRFYKLFSQLGSYTNKSVERNYRNLELSKLVFAYSLWIAPQQVWSSN